ncbi:MAG: hypothetical protein ACE5J9_06230 [Methanosarcinales archaeon]
MKLCGGCTFLIKFGISIDEELMILVDATVQNLRSLDVSKLINTY